MKRPIRTLLFSTLYPSSVRPVHGIFVETRLRELLKTGEVETRVVAPVPWFPFSGERFGEYGKFAATPHYEMRNGIEVHHPRYLLPPRVGMNVAPYALARAAMPIIQKLSSNGFDFDLIDAHYYYPDGVAAGLIAQKLGKPFFVTARGSDLNVIANFEKPRRLIAETASKANASIGVSKALMEKLSDLGADPNKLHVLRNGVDLKRFEPIDRGEARRMLGLPQQDRLLISVGRLVEAKGHHLAIEAIAVSPKTNLVIVGTGPEKENLRILAKRLGVEHRLTFVEQVPNEDLKWWYSAADALVLFSEREGWANVLLEAMACGTPVIATKIPGTIDVVTSPAGGVLVSVRDALSLCDGIRKLFGDLPSRQCIREYAEGFSWAETCQGQINLFKNI